MTRTRIPTPQIKGKYFFVISCLQLILYKLDVHMNSPPTSPPQFGLGGASRVTGGILHGQAYGNIFNHANAEMEFCLEPRMGKVHIYRSLIDPTLTKLDMVLKHKVTPKIKPILKALARGYSPVRSKLFIISQIILSILCR